MTLAVEFKWNFKLEFDIKTIFVLMFFYSIEFVSCLKWTFMCCKSIVWNSWMNFNTEKKNYIKLLSFSVLGYDLSSLIHSKK